MGATGTVGDLTEICTVAVSTNHTVMGIGTEVEVAAEVHDVDTAV